MNVAGSGQALDHAAMHFAAFSFIDRITSIEPGVRAHGLFAVPRDVTAFTSCLVAEAVGQLAAWVAMAHVAFRSRPVAALANEARFHSDVAPGDALELGVEIETFRSDAVAYSGWAKRGKEMVIELVDCLAPMLPVEEFDSPAALAERFSLLCGRGAEPGRFRGVPVPDIAPGVHGPGESLTQTLHVPTAAPFFADHFPRRAVFPATLLLDSQIGLGLRLAYLAGDRLPGTEPVPVRMTHVKMRSFIRPGELLTLGAQRTSAGEHRIMMSARTHGKLVATARLEYAMRKVER